MKIDEIKLDDGRVIVEVDTVSDREHLESLGVDVDAIEAEEASKQKAAEERAYRKMHAVYNGEELSLTSEDANGLLQVKAAFEMGVTETVFHWANGNKTLIKAEDFPALAAWFIMERNKLFVGGAQ